MNSSLCQSWPVNPGLSITRGTESDTFLCTLCHASPQAFGVSRPSRGSSQGTLRVPRRSRLANLGRVVSSQLASSDRSERVSSRRGSPLLERRRLFPFQSSHQKLATLAGPNNDRRHVPV